MAGLIELITTAFTRIVAWTTAKFQQGLESGYDSLSASLFGTPAPTTGDGFVLGRPTNNPWEAVYDALVVGEITMFALLVLVVCVQARHAVAAAGFIGRSTDTRAGRSAWIGAVLIVTWYWAASIALYLVDGLTLALLPRLGTVLDTLAVHLDVAVSNPALGLVLAVAGGTAMWLLQALFIVRKIVLPIVVYAMPLGIAIAYGGVPLVSRVAFAFVLRFVPLALAPLPAALVLRGYELTLATGVFGLSTSFGRTLLVVSLPVVLLVVTWKVFTYSNPRATQLVGGSMKTGAVLGIAAAGATAGSSAVGLTAARFGPKAAAGHAAFNTLAGSRSESESKSVRRTEHDPLEESR